MIALWIFTVYTVIALTSWVPLARAEARTQRSEPHCHREGSFGYYWPSQTDCRRYCKGDCWRTDPDHQVDGNDVAWGALYATGWPIAYGFRLVQWAANTKPLDNGPRLSRDDRRKVKEAASAALLEAAIEQAEADARQAAIEMKEAQQ
jgi:hypothetical protein